MTGAFVEDRTPAFLRGDAIAGIPVITVTGTPRAMGSHLGQRLQARVQVLVQSCFALLRSLTSPGAPDDRDLAQRDYAALRGAVAGAGPAMQALDPALWMEFSAMAEACGLGIEDLLLAESFADLLSLRSVPVPSANASTVVVPAVCGPLCQGFAWFLPAELAPCVTLVRRIPDHGPSTLTLTVAGLAPVAGLAESGLAATSNELRVRDGAGDGVPCSFQLATALNAPTWDDAAVRLRAGRRLGGAAFHLLGRKGERLSLECSGTLARPLLDPQNDLPRVHTNHALDADIAARAAEHLDPTSRPRLARLARRSMRARGADITGVDAWFDPGSQAETAFWPGPAPGAQVWSLTALLLPREKILHLHRGPSPSQLHAIGL